MDILIGFEFNKANLLELFSKFIHFIKQTRTGQFRYLRDGQTRIVQLPCHLDYYITEHKPRLFRLEDNGQETQSPLVSCVGQFDISGYHLIYNL